MLTVRALLENQFVVKLSQYWNLHNFQYQNVEFKRTMVLEIWLVNKEVARHVFSGLLPKHPFHFASHDLNLALSKACDINDIQCMLNVIKTVGILFKYSPKKQVSLDECVESSNRGAVENGTKTIYLRKAKLLCDTRWVERHTSIFYFCSLLGVIIYCLDIITQNDDESRKWDLKSITEADDLLHIMCSSSILVALNCAQILF